MTSTTFFLIFIPLLAFILLAVNLIFAPHNPYQEKDSAFECGFHSFLGQNRTQFSISFFIFAFLFLLFDLEILLVYPYIVSAYVNDIYGLVMMLIFFLVLTLGFAFELGKNALKIDSRQASSTLPYKRHESISMPLNSGLDTSILELLMNICNDPNILSDFADHLLNDLYSSLPNINKDVDTSVSTDYTIDSEAVSDHSNSKKISDTFNKWDGIRSIFPDINDIIHYHECKDLDYSKYMDKCLKAMIAPSIFSATYVYMNQDTTAPNVEDVRNNLVRDYEENYREFVLRMQTLRNSMNRLNARNAVYLTRQENWDITQDLVNHMTVTQTRRNTIIDSVEHLGMLSVHLSSLYDQLQPFGGYVENYRRHLNLNMITIPARHAQFWSYQEDSFLTITNNLDTFFSWTGNFDSQENPLSSLLGTRRSLEDDTPSSSKHRKS